MPDDEAPVVEANMGGEFKMPTLWIYDADGKRIKIIRQGTIPQIIEQVKAVLAD